MPADILPIELRFDERELFTLWAPRWRDAGDEWEALLGDEDDLFAFESVADLVTFVRGGTENDLSDHPAWESLVEGPADALDPDDDHQFDLIGVYDALAEEPTEESVAALNGTLAIVSAIGSVCELPAVTKFFNGNPVLSEVSAGLENFTGRAGVKRWNEIGSVVDKGWEKVIDAIEDVITTPEVDSAKSAEVEEELADLEEKRKADEEAAAKAAEEKAAAKGDDDEDDDDTEDVDQDDDHDDDDEDEDEVDEAAAAAGAAVLGADEDFWLKVGIDPVQMITASGTFYTLRCYLDDAPIFLGRNGRVSVFGSGGALARYLADEHDHDLSELSTYDDIRTAATDGSLRVNVSEDNIYVLTGLSEDIADGPDTVDRDQLDLAVELLRDVGEYSEDDVVEETLADDEPLGRFVNYVLEPASGDKPEGPYAEAAEEFDELAAFLDTRLRRE